MLHVPQKMAASLTDKVTRLVRNPVGIMEPMNGRRHSRTRTTGDMCPDGVGRIIIRPIVPRSWLITARVVDNLGGDQLARLCHLRRGGQAERYVQSSLWGCEEVANWFERHAATAARC